MRDAKAKLDEANRREQSKRAAQARQKALEHNITQAEKGDAYGQFRMGERYRDGDGVEKDSAKAVEYFMKAAQQGHRDAKNRARKNEAATKKFAEINKHLDAPY